MNIKEGEIFRRNIVFLPGVKVCKALLVLQV
jgi:hypothetical protein